MSKSAPLQYGNYYHIYNRGNNREDLFVEERNYPYFLKLHTKYVEPIADTYAYCLLCNHFHFLVRFNEREDLTGFENLSGLRVSNPSQNLSNFFNAYAKAFNKAYDRTGALFQRPFGRAKVESQTHLMWLVVYIHQNPQEHGFVSDFRGWTYSSYRALISTKPTRLKRQAVLEWFDGLKGFEIAHREELPENQLTPLVLEEFV